MILLLVFLCAGFIQSVDSRDAAPQYTKDGQLLRPDNYREWIFLSSGLGMTYDPARESAPRFTNVFVMPSSYRQFMATGKWPDKTMFVVEGRLSSTKGSINKAGHFQAASTGIGVEVKDESRPEKWSYFSFRAADETAKVQSKESCWQC